LETTLAPFGRREKPQVSSRIAVSFIKSVRPHTKSGPFGSVAIESETTGERSFLTRLCLFLLIFRKDSSQRNNPNRRCGITLDHDEMMLLTLTAGLTPLFRFAFDRHNFATDCSPCRPLAGLCGAEAAHSTRGTAERITAIRGGHLPKS
jgi:hypothetical protein